VWAAMDTTSAPDMKNLHTSLLVRAVNIYFL
jgi:hypothetical protein